MSFSRNDDEVVSTQLLVLAGLTVSQGINFLASFSNSQTPEDLDAMPSLYYIPIVAGLSLLTTGLWASIHKCKGMSDHAKLISTSTLSGVATGALHLIPRLPWYGSSLIGAATIGIGLFCKKKVDTQRSRPATVEMHTLIIDDESFEVAITPAHRSELELGLLENAYPIERVRQNSY